jgi:hypothetical protein
MNLPLTLVSSVATAAVTAAVTAIPFYFKLNAARTDMKTANMGLEIARTNLQASQAELRKFELQLRDTQTQLASAHTRLVAEEIKRFMQKTECHGSAICSEILCLLVAENYDQAIESLNSLETALMGVRDLRPPVEWLQRVLASVCDEKLPFQVELVGGHDRKTSSSDRSKLRLSTKAVDCYLHLLPWVSDRSLQVAITDCMRWLSRMAAVRSDAARLIASVLRKDPGNKGLQDKYVELLSIDDYVVTDDERRIAVLRGLHGLKDLIIVLKQNDCLALLDAGLHTALRHWQFFGTPCSDAFTDFLRLSGSPEGDERALLNTLAHRVADHISFQSPGILAPSRSQEYAALRGIIRDIHSKTGIPRQLRPQNRHVVPPLRSIAAVISGKKNATSIRGNLGNFSLGESGWTAGVWMTSNEDPWWTSPESWISGSLSLSADPNIHVKKVEVKGPIEEHNNPHGHRYGFRIRMPTLSETERVELELLAKECPLKR